MLKQPQIINGPVGALEAIVQLPEQADNSRFGIICHPHPLQEGTMHNKVVTTIAKAFNNQSIPCIRFNFRGVGASAGTFGNITGEVDDCMAVVAWVRAQFPQADLIFAGFSFGAYVAAAAASVVSTKQLITIAPSVERMPYTELAPVLCPWLVIQGEEDDVVDPQAVYAWYAQLNANKSMVRFPATGHFFHGKLVALQQVLESNLASNGQIALDEN